MKNETRKGLRRGEPHSEKAGEAALDSGGRAAVYRALLGLTCSRCGGVIREGELFTREAGPAGGLPLLRLCRGCVPFRAGGGLLDALLAPDSGDEKSPGAPAADVREKALARLGPALAAGRRRRKDQAG
ncbi:MAG TPA: hypothetical protein VF591_29460 [Pyrinomonadaceae bacterium]|jgi:hypothetical protein